MSSTSDFTQPAYHVAEETGGTVRLLNGERFLRYIGFVNGSRLVGEDADAAGFHQPLIAPDCLFEADAVPRVDPAKTTVLAVANAKGGVAKTTTALNLAFALTEKHSQRVLLIDMDGQGSLTGLLPQPVPSPASGRRRKKLPSWPPPPEVAFLADYFMGSTTLRDLVRPTRFEHLWLVPADERLFRLDMSDGVTVESVLKFVRDLHDQTLVAPDGEPFTWIVLDTPPAQSFCTRAALAASHYVVLPACAETMAVRGAKWALTSARTMRALMGGRVEVVGCLLTRWKSSAPTNLALSGLSDLLRLNSVRLFPTKVSEDAKIERGHMETAWGKLKNLLHLPAGKAAQAYAAFAGVVLPYGHHG